MRTIFLALVLALGLTACAKNVSYHPGWVTKEIFGQLEPKDAFVLIERQDQTFMPSGSGGQQTRISVALVQRNGKGEYHIQLPDETKGVSLLFIAQGYRPQRARFDRTLGVKAYEFDVTLEESKDWKGDFFLTLRPYLSRFITERRYAMKAEQQHFLGQWLNRNEDQLQ